MKEWYLIGRPSMTSGGYENEVFKDYRDDAISDFLDTELASTVTLYNYDLSESKEIRCIVQGNSADTQLKSMERVGLFIRGTVKAGMYIFFENRYWLIIGYPSYNGVYEKAVMQLCQYKLRWQNTIGEIIERWCNLTSASKYDTGEKNNSTIILTSDNLTLLLPDDTESLDLDGKRVFIDKRKVNPTKVYKITRTDSVLYDFGEEHGGILSFIADKTELNLATDRQDLRLCDYIDPTTIPSSPQNPDESVLLSAKIIGKDTIRYGMERTYSVEFTDNENIEDVNFKWNIVSDFCIERSDETKNPVKLYIEDDSAINKPFLLQVIVNDSVVAELEITVTDLL